MTRIDAMPEASAPADKAVVVFTGDIALDLGASSVLTVYDENKHFLGQLFEHSAFAAELAPGPHRFAAVDLEWANADSVMTCGQTFEAELAPGKIYVANIRLQAPAEQPANSVVPAQVLWQFANPSTEPNPRRFLHVWKAGWHDVGGGYMISGWTMPELKPTFLVDRVRGQAFLDQLATKGKLCIPPPGEPTLSAGSGYDRLPPEPPAKTSK